jgi:hypothetical protein
MRHGGNARRSSRPATLAAILLTAVASIAAPASAQEEDATRLATYLALGFGGDADTTVGDLSGSASLDPTVGFGARVEQPLHEFVVVGGAFELLTFEADVRDSEREALFDFDGLLRIRYPFQVANRSLWIEPYVALPLGFSMAVLDDPDGSGDEVWPGWNIGALAGVYLLLTDAPFGFFFEAGWRHHQVYNEAQGPFGADVDLKLVTNQFAMHLGAAFLLE